MDRLLLLFVLLFGSLAGMHLFAQDILDEEVRIRRGDNTLVGALQQLVDQDIPLSFREDQVIGFFVDVNTGRAQSLRNWLDQLLEGTGLKYELSPSGRRIIILIDERLLELELTLYGHIIDAKSGERLLGANIYSPDLKQGTMSNFYGFYSMDIQGGVRELIVSYTGYAPFRSKILFTRDSVLDIALQPDATLPEVIVLPTVDSLLPVGVEPPGDYIDPQDSELLPGPGGEVDPLRNLSLIPGITTGPDGLGGFFIRGSDAGHNLVLLDGVPVFNFGHAAGWFSIFNAQAIRRIDLHKEAIPTRFGGRLAGVLDIHTRDGNLYYNQFKLGTSIGSSRFTAEGPLIKGESSFLITGRYFWGGQLVRRFSEQYKNNLGRDGRVRYQLYDVNFKLNQQLGARDRLYFSFFRGLDDYDNTSRQESEQTVINNAGALFRYSILQAKRESVAWENTIGTIRWNHIFNDRFFGNFTFSYSNLDVDAAFVRIDSLQEEVGSAETGTYYFETLASSLRQLGVAFDGQYNLGSDERLDFGVRLNQHRFITGLNNENELNEEPDDPDFSNTTTEQPLEIAPYASLEVRRNRWLFRAGLRGQVWWSRGEANLSVEPRLMVTHQVSPRLDWRLAFDVNSQPIHRLSSSTIGLPTDLWVPSRGAFKPARSNQLSLRGRWLWTDNWRLEVGGYWREMAHLLAYAPGAERNSDWVDNVSIGSGQAQGLEFMIARRRGEGRLSGWLSYTLANSDRTFDEAINAGKTFPFRYDRTHSLGFALFYKLSDKVSFSTSWRIASGAAYSFNIESFNLPEPSEVFLDDPDNIVLETGARNRFRLPADHRLDFNFHFDIPNRNRRVWHRFNLGVYNAYNRRNPLYYDLRTDYSSRNGALAADRYFVQVFLAPIIPVLSYELNLDGRPQ